MDQTEKDKYILVHKETVVKCCNCGFEYEVQFTKEFSEENPADRICIDCIEGDID